MARTTPLPAGAARSPTARACCAARALVDEVYVDDKIKDYIVDLVFATREPGEYGLDIGRLIEYGASPRATIYLALAAKAHAFLARPRLRHARRTSRRSACDVLRHRVIVTYEAEAEERRTPTTVIQRIFDSVPVP